MERSGSLKTLQRRRHGAVVRDDQPRLAVTLDQAVSLRATRRSKIELSGIAARRSREQS